MSDTEQTETKEERKKRLTKERQRKWYAENQEKKRALNNARYQKVEKQILQYKKPTISKKTDFTENEIINLIQTDESIENEKTKQYLVGGAKRFFRVAECDSLRCLKSDYKLAINRITDKDTNAYSNNTIRSTLSAIASIINRYVGSFIPTKVKKYLDDVISETNLILDDELKEIQQTIQYPTFDEYVRNTLDEYGVNSKEHFIANLYRELSVRDNFGQIPVLGKPLKNKTINYIVVKKNYSYIVLNDYKTKNKYGSFRYTFSPKFDRLLRKYMKENDIQIDSLLFQEPQLSPLVSKMNKEMGYDNMGGINIFRHIRVSEIPEGASYSDKVKLANEMNHSVFVQPKYKRKIEIMPN
jgi:hypothetical protein